MGGLTAGSSILFFYAVHLFFQALQVVNVYSIVPIRSKMSSATGSLTRAISYPPSRTLPYTKKKPPRRRIRAL